MEEAGDLAHASKPKSDWSSSGDQTSVEEGMPRLSICTIWNYLYRHSQVRNILHVSSENNNTFF